MTIQVSGLTPYASFIVAHAKVMPPVPNNLRSMLKARIDGTASTVSSLRIRSIPGLTFSFGYHFTEQRAVTWGGTTGVTDTLNHLLVCFGLGEFVLIYSSDSELKNELQNDLYAGNLNGWQPADQRILVDAYVKGQPLKALWLGGAHRDVSYRPTSKILSGQKLQDAIDPFGDSTFIAGAVRTGSAGVSLKRSGIWFRPCKDWHSFQSLALTELTGLNNRQVIVSTLSSSVHHGLAQQLEEFTDVFSAYACQWADIDTISGKTRSEKLQQLLQNYELDISAPQGVLGSLGKLDLEIKVISTGVIDVASLTPKILSGRVEFDCTVSTPAIQNCVDSILADPTLVRIYYDSGHTITDATLSIALIQDRKFDFDYCDFSLPGVSYDVKKEKPDGKPVPLQNMFSGTDDSLFTWFFQHGLTQLGLAQPQPGRCWLYCDDGSGEVADFIHLDLGPTPPNPQPCITLIHVKGANNNNPLRRVAVGPYEVVTAQAMKNLRRMIAGEMKGEIQKSIATHGNSRVWTAPWTINLTSPAIAGSSMLTALDGIGVNCTYQVIVVQPHVQKTTYNANTQGQAAKQLRSLLFGAEALTHAAGARFRVVCDNV